MNAMRGRIEELVSSLHERDEARRRWIAQVSHDLRTPLTALGVSLDRMTGMIAADGGRPDKATGLESVLAAASLDVRRVQTMAEDLLEIGRLEAGDELVLEPVPLGELLERTAAALSPLAMDRDVELRYLPEPGLPLLHADGGRLSRLLENLLGNAIRHARSSVELKAVVTDDLATVVVSDDGPGFPGGEGAIDLAAVASGRDDRGSGLGIRVARCIADAHGGRLEAENRRRGGAEVRVILPRRAGAR